MKTKLYLVAVVALLALVVSACGPTTINQQALPPQRTVSVMGSGMAYLVPDIAYIYVGVHTEESSAADAVKENNAQTQKVIEALKKFGIDSKDIRTTNFSIWPQERYDPQTGASTGQKTYVVDNTVYVTVRDLDKLGDLLDTVIAAGANTVNSIQFDVADKDAALKQARADAVKDAEAKAQELAGAAGLSLGEIQSIGFSDSQPYPIFGGKGGGGAAAEAAVPIQPGQLTFTVTVNVTYEIK
ncbi:MAG: SIMPL domain-containing protein [Anaerolineales bacterium]|nr:SIMPL domain-containing protein [Anaerolineales bacterium]NUQ85604.1 SIMPL domain-containing protein [Anaerolineales bacterium]